MIKLIQSVFSVLGFKIQRKENPRGWNPNYLSNLKEHFQSLIDIGVANGTPQLYSAFPNKNVVLIEPLVDYKPSLNRLDKDRFRTIYKAVGSKKELITINVNKSSITKSSFFKRLENIPQGKGLIEERDIEVDTLDSLFKDGQFFNPPFLIKIDTEGFELDVVKGAEKVLRSTMYVIAEVTIKQRFKGSYEASEFILEMKNHDFEIFDILHLNHDPLNNGVLYADMVFINKNL